MSFCWNEINSGVKSLILILCMLSLMTLSLWDDCLLYTSRDCYICHFLLHLPFSGKEEVLKISVIDLHRAQIRAKVPESSDRLHAWFVNTKLYKQNLESYVQGRGMTWTTKIRVMVTVTLVMSVGFALMMLKSLYIPCAILGGVWVFHLLYFIFGVKTLPKAKITAAKAQPEV